MIIFMFRFSPTSLLLSGSRSSSTSGSYGHLSTGKQNRFLVRPFKTFFLAVYNADLIALSDFFGHVGQLI